jgi:hypothetical protein
MVFTICKHIPWRFIILGTGYLQGILPMIVLGKK